MMHARIKECRKAGLIGVLALLGFLFHPLGCGLAAEKAGPFSGERILKSDAPLQVASDRMEANQKERTILFEGHVVVQQEDLTITGNRLKVFAAAGEKEKSQGAQSAMMDKIDRIEVEGEVRITQREGVATAEKAVYYHQEQKIVLIGRPSVSQGRDTVRGRLITLYLEQGRSVVEGGEEGPVQAVLHPARKE